jgi:hypothetical protein
MYLGKSDWMVPDTGARQLRATLTMTFIRKSLELCFLPDHQVLLYGVGMQPEGLADTPKGEKLIAIFV